MQRYKSSLKRTIRNSPNTYKDSSHPGIYLAIQAKITTRMAEHHHQHHYATKAIQIRKTSAHYILNILITCSITGAIS